MILHTRRGMGAEDYCTCDGPWPCPKVAEAVCGVCGRVFEPDTEGQDVCEPCFREAHRPVTEQELLLALEVASLAAGQAMRDGDMQEWLRQSALGAAVHEDLAQVYGWRANRSTPAPGYDRTYAVVAAHEIEAVPNSGGGFTHYCHVCGAMGVDLAPTLPCPGPPEAESD